MSASDVTPRVVSNLIEEAANCPRGVEAMDLRTFKPLDRTTAVLEIWNKELLVARVFARPDGVRRFHFSKESARWGPQWEILSKLAAHVTELLDAADEDMRQARARAGA